MHANHHHFTLDAREIPERWGNENAPLRIELHIDRFGIHHSPELPDIAVRGRQFVDAIGKGFPRFHGVERDTAVEAPSEYEAIRKLLTEPRRDGQTALGVQIVSVTTKEHRMTNLYGFRVEGERCSVKLSTLDSTYPHLSPHLST